MNQFFRKLTLFSLAVIPFYVVGLYIWSKVARTEWLGNAVYEIPVAGYTRKRLVDAAAVDSVDILFLGSSHTYRGFDVRLFDSLGLKSFNLGSSAQTPLQTNVLLTRYLPRLRPKLVIYEVYPLTFTSDGIESTIDLLKSGPLDFPVINLCLRQRSIRALNGLILASADRLPFPKVSPSVESSTSPDQYISGGFVERVSAARNNRATKPVPISLVLRESQLEVFDENLDLLHSYGASILIVQAPYSSALYRSFTNREFFDQLMASKGDYANYNKRLHIIDSIHLIDNDHLSQQGVILFNKVLMADIQGRIVSH